MSPHNILPFFFLAKELNTNFKIPKRKLEQNELNVVEQQNQVMENPDYHFMQPQIVYAPPFPPQPLQDCHEAARNLILQSLVAQTREVEKPKTYANHICELFSK